MANASVMPTVRIGEEAWGAPEARLQVTERALDLLVKRRVVEIRQQLMSPAVATQRDAFGLQTEQRAPVGERTVAQPMGAAAHRCGGNEHLRQARRVPSKRLDRVEERVVDRHEVAAPPKAGRSRRVEVEQLVLRERPQAEPPEQPHLGVELLWRHVEPLFARRVGARQTVVEDDRIPGGEATPLLIGRL
jgi:hypothetical protein